MHDIDRRIDDTWPHGRQVPSIDRSSKRTCFLATWSRSLESGRKRSIHGHNHRWYLLRSSSVGTPTLNFRSLTKNNIQWAPISSPPKYSLQAYSFQSLLFSFSIMSSTILPVSLQNRIWKSKSFTACWTQRTVWKAARRGFWILRKVCGTCRRLSNNPTRIYLCSKVSICVSCGKATRASL